MKTKRIEQFVKEYFYFSKTERNGIIGLLIILVFLLSLPTLYALVFPSKPFLFSVENLPVPDTSFTSSGESFRVLFSFDPNSASDAELRQLGFSERNIITLHRYLAKGGHFKRPEDLHKMFGLRKDLVNELIPYVNIQGERNTGFPATTKDSVSAKKYNKQPLELNSADTAALIALYRVGPAMARRIVDYRTRLGGFLSLDQLMEVYGFDEDLLYDLNGKITVDASRVRLFELNEVTADELKQHPYFKYKLSNAIINYRLQHGPYQSLSDLKKIVIVNDSIYGNIIKYLRIK